MFLLRFVLGHIFPMAVNSIDVAFTKQFESEVHLAYQRMGSKLLNTVRRKTNVVGKSTTFQIIGKGIAGTKTRGGQVPILNLVHTNVECTLADRYGGEFIDKLDELKIEHDERQAVSMSIAGALGRASDQDIMDVTDTFTQETTATGVVTQAKIEEAFEYFGNNDVPDDGQRFLAVAPQGWTDLMGLSTFASLDYVPESDLPFPKVGFSAKNWFSFNIFTFSGITLTGGTIRQNVAYHKSAIGHASGQDVMMDITWQGKEQSHLAVGSMSMNAVIIDDIGGYRIRSTET
jgi:flagellar hook-associated protein FlgK